MSCTCNQSINCDPCAFCTPPGVTCLTTCEPVDPCPEKIDIGCVIYSGEDHPCSDIANGQPISQIMLQALALIFPIEECCYFEATVVLITPPPQRYTFCYSYDDGSCGRACECDETTSTVSLYSLDNPLVVGSVLYSDPNFNTQAPEGWYSVDGNCYVISGGALGIIPGVSGAVQSISPCVTPTTTAAPTTTLAPCYCFTVTVTALTTISYFNCEDGSFTTTPNYDPGDIVKICAQSVDLSNNYTFPNPTQYCGDRIACPTTTSTTTAAPTTSTTTLPPCNCIIFSNYGGQATIGWTDCNGRNQTATILQTIDGITPAIIQRCGSNGFHSGEKIDIVVNGACIGSGASAECPTSETTILPCSEFLLYCCGSVDDIVSIKPCYPNAVVPLAINNMYSDEKGRRWIVVGSGGTPTVISYFPQLTYLGQSTLGNCQAISTGQLCPGAVPTTTLPIVKELKYSAEDCIDACVTLSSVSVYSNCAVLAVNCRLYSDAGLTIPITTVGYYSDGINSFYVDNTGRCVQQSSCAQCTTAPPTTVPPVPTNPNTIELRNDVAGQPTNNAGFPVIISFGLWVNNTVSTFGTVTWDTPFANLTPLSSITGTYSIAPTDRLAMTISRTWNGATANGVPIQPAYTGYYYAKTYRNNQEVGCVRINTGTTNQTFPLADGITFSNGDAIKVVLTKTGGGIFCP